MIHDERIRHLNDNAVRGGDYVIYWMQAAQRATFNHALEYAIDRANEHRVPLIAFFGITDDFPDANARHYHFMLEGLRETQQILEKRGIKLIVRHQSPEQALPEIARRAVLVVVDCGYLRIERQWRRRAAEAIDCPLIQVETNVVVPVEVTSDKEEFAARTIRGKIVDKIDHFLQPLRHRRPTRDSLGIRLKSFDIDDVPKAVSRLKIDHSVPPAPYFRGGTSHAQKHLKNFIENKLAKYPDARNDPNIDGLSNMSPYLHFGQMSALQIAMEVEEAGGPGEDAYLEELIVRRELSMNFVYYNENYDTYRSLPDWSRKTLETHAADAREHHYSLEQWETADTHDPYWNAAQNEMICTGKMHGYMRMYWGKKVLEWTADLEEAYRIALYLNNKYEIDGRDPNGFTGVAWCFGKHDRAWAERPVFGKIRYMSEGGLRRKFDARAYVEKIERECSQNA